MCVFSVGSGWGLDSVSIACYTVFTQQRARKRGSGFSERPLVTVELDEGSFVAKYPTENALRSPISAAETQAEAKLRYGSGAVKTDRPHPIKARRALARAPHTYYAARGYIRAGAAAPPRTSAASEWAVPPCVSILTSVFIVPRDRFHNTLKIGVFCFTDVTRISNPVT